MDTFQKEREREICLFIDEAGQERLSDQEMIIYIVRALWASWLLGLCLGSLIQGNLHAVIFFQPATDPNICTRQTKNDGILRIKILLMHANNLKNRRPF